MCSQLRSLNTAPAQATTTHTTPVTPLQVMMVNATPTGPKPVHPDSKSGNTMRTTQRKIATLITAPVRPAASSVRQVRGTFGARSMGVLPQKTVETTIASGTSTGFSTSRSEMSMMRSTTAAVAKYMKNHTVPRQRRCPIEYCGRCQARANMREIVSDIGMPQNRNPNIPATVHT